jgi:hypothetical protein
MLSPHVVIPERPDSGFRDDGIPERGAARRLGHRHIGDVGV